VATNGGLATMAELARHLRAALASEHTEQKLDFDRVMPAAFFDSGAMMSVVRHDDVIRVTAETEAGAIITCDLDHHRAARLGAGLLDALDAPKTAEIREWPTHSRLRNPA
jgi:hypothetical protein